MKLPGYTAELPLSNLDKHYAASMSFITQDEMSITPQYCGPCINGRRQCGDYQWVCYRDPDCIFGSECPIHCYQGGFHNYSIPCGTPPPPPLQLSL